MCELEQAVIDLHNIARVVDTELGVESTHSNELRAIADRLSTYVQQVRKTYYGL